MIMNGSSIEKRIASKFKRILSDIYKIKGFSFWNYTRYSIYEILLYCAPTRAIFIREHLLSYYVNEQIYHSYHIPNSLWIGIIM